MCEECDNMFDEFEMNFKEVQKDKRALCKNCRDKIINNRYWIEEYDKGESPLAYRCNVGGAEPFIKESLLDEIKHMHSKLKKYFAELEFTGHKTHELFITIDNLIITLNKKGD